MILGLGVDLVEVARFERAVARQGVEFLHGFLLPVEIRRCALSHHPPSSHALAFAGKEALFKALGTGRSGPIAWHDVAMPARPDGVLQFPDGGHSAEEVLLGGATSAALDRMGVVRIHLSRRLCRGTASRLALAMVVLEGDGKDNAPLSGNRGREEEA